MKKILRFGILSLLVCACLVSCKKDKGNDTPANQIKIGGQQVEFAVAVLENYGSGSDGVCNFDLTLFSKGLNVTVDDVTLTGTALYFEMFTTDASGLASGAYRFSDSCDAMTFSSDSACNQGDFGGESGSVTDFSGGSLTVTRNGNTYKVVVDGTLKDGRKVSGTYEGTPIRQDHTDN